MVNAKAQKITREYKEQLEKELTNRKVVMRDEIKARIAEARAQGDLSENADYSAAREDEGNNEARIREIEEILKFAEIIDSIHVEVEFVDMKKTFSYEVTGSEFDPFNNKISSESPLAKAMEAHEVGDTFVFRSESGRDVKVKLLSRK